MIQRFVCVSLVWNSTHLSREAALQMEVGLSGLHANAELTHEVAETIDDCCENHSVAVLQLRQNSGLWTHGQLDLLSRPPSYPEPGSAPPHPCLQAFCLSWVHPLSKREDSSLFQAFKFVFCYLSFLTPSSTLWLCMKLITLPRDKSSKGLWMFILLFFQLFKFIPIKSHRKFLRKKFVYLTSVNFSLTLVRTEYSNQEKLLGDFSGGPVAKIPCSQCRVPGFDPWSGN